ncbi:VOC family protein [Nocardia sp. NPDC049707]|uniref:VOC family protein n=1 Tax=Nocardia sp. NPDC049707 TaxID=3154735 RepID=UPI00342DA0D7
MSINSVAHLNFTGNARAALEFYQSVFGGELSMATYGDFGMPEDLPDADKVVFGQVVADSGFRVMAYDVPSQSQLRPSDDSWSSKRENGTTLTNAPFFMSVRGESVDEVAAVWNTLSEGATVIEEYGPAPWAPAFGMLSDRFGITWILDVTSGQS